MKLSTISLTSALIAFAFTPLSATAGETDRAVKDYCRCVEPIFEDTQKMLDAMNSGNLAVLQSMAQNIEKVGEDATKCMEKLKAKYGDKFEDKDFQEKVKAGTEKACPNPMKDMMKMMPQMPPM